MSEIVGWLRLHRWAYYLLLFLVGGGIGLWYQDNYYNSWRELALIGIPLAAIWGCYLVYRWSKSK